MSELDNFVVYVPGLEKMYYIKATEKNVTICKEAYMLLEQPEFVNVFFDEKHNRVMIKPADRNFPNIIRLTKPKEGHHIATLCCKGLALKILKMLGKKRVYGHPCPGGMIFEHDH